MENNLPNGQNPRPNIDMGTNKLQLKLGVIEKE